MINYAHRGASEYAPENTMAAFYLGLEMGADGIETDVRETADGVLVLFHDETLERLTGETLQIAELSYAELYARDLGSYKKKFYENEKVVLLEDFLRYLSARKAALAIELKAAGIEKRVVDLIDQYGCEENTVITSFHFEYLVNIRTFNQEIKLGYLCKTPEENILDTLIRHGIMQYCPAVRLVTRELVEKAHAKGLNVRAYGIKSIEDMEKAIDCGVDGMTINFPDILAKVKKERML